MAIQLTPRMVSWIEACGCHLAVSTPDGAPYVIMARYASVQGDNLVFGLTQEEARAVIAQLEQNPWVACGVSQVGGIRAAYQFKGSGKLLTSGSIYEQVSKEANEALAGRFHAVLIVKLSDVYCTKPGHVAGTRMDTASEGMEKFEEDLGWKDFAPPKKR
jgi:hypothetical protein